MYIARVHMRNLYPFQNYHFRKDSGCVRGIGCFGTQELWTSSFSSSIGPCHQSSCWPRLWRESLRSKFALPGSTTRASRGRHASYRRKFVATHYSHFVAAVGTDADAGANVTVAFGTPLPRQVTASPDCSPYPTNYHKTAELVLTSTPEKRQTKTHSTDSKKKEKIFTETNKLFYVQVM